MSSTKGYMDRNKRFFLKHFWQAEWVVCPACHQSLLCVHQSSVDVSGHLYGDRCPRRLDVLPADPVYRLIDDSLPPTAALEAFPEREEVMRVTEAQFQRAEAPMRAIEALLKPCTCGGTFRFDAPRRCFSCSTPVITEYPEGVDLYLNGAAFEEHFEAEQKRMKAWKMGLVQFPDGKDMWKNVN
jgi:uncharacterized protein YbaR (Trm112 family)